MALAENALTTVDNIKLIITDLEKETLINAASEILETWCNREFAKKQYTEKRMGTGSQYLILRHRPIHSVDQIIISGKDVTQEISYDILPEAGMLFRPDGWPETDGYDIEITLTAGYVLPKDDNNPDPRDLPQGMEYACIMMVNELYNKLNADFSIQRQTRGGISTTYFEHTDKLPGPVRALIAPYRNDPL